MNDYKYLKAQDCDLGVLYRSVEGHILTVQGLWKNGRFVKLWRMLYDRDGGYCRKIKLPELAMVKVNFYMQE